MITGQLLLAILMGSAALCVSVLSGHPPLTWLLTYSFVGVTTLLALAYFSIRSEDGPGAAPGS